MGKVTKDRKTILRTFMTNLKAKKQENDSKGSYQKAQERIIARKTALARKRARETAAKHQTALRAVIEDDKLLPNQDPMLNLGQSLAIERDKLLLKTLDQGQMGSSQAYASAAAIQLQYRVAQQALPINKDPFIQPIGDPTLHPTPDPSIGERFLKHGTSE